MFEKISDKVDQFMSSPEAYIHDGWFNIKVCFDRITGDKRIFILYIIATIYILIKVKNKKPKGFLVFYPVVVACIVCCPIFFFLVKEHLQIVYFRMFWLFPAEIVIAYACVDFIYTFSKKYVRFASFIGCVTVIMFCGTFIYTETNFTKVNNLYKVPDEAKWISDIILQDDIEYKYVLAVPEVVPYLRQINTDIKLVYGRDVDEMYTDWWPTQIKTGNVKSMLTQCKKNNVTYVVLYNNVKLNDLTYKYGYHILAQTYSYDVYKYK